MSTDHEPILSVAEWTGWVNQHRNAEHNDRVYAAREMLESHDEALRASRQELLDTLRELGEYTERLQVGIGIQDWSALRRAAAVVEREEKRG